MLRFVTAIAFSFVVSAAFSIHAVAKERFALVIGNSKYQTVTPLENPSRDAKAVTALLNEAGFEVTTALDLDKTSMSRAIRYFTTRMAGKPDDTVTLIYFAGHGLQVDGENYLVPVDANIARESDVPLESLRLADLMNMLENVKSRSRIVLLDACRNNPFADIAKGAPRGLALVNAPAGTLLAYSTSPGTTADDGIGSLSPFAAALLKSAKEPGLPIEQVLKTVRLSVHGATQGRQTPWEVSALTEPFAFFAGNGMPRPDPRGGKAADKDAQTWRKELQALSPQRAYDLALREDIVVIYEQYLALYADDPRAVEIRAIFERRQEMTAWLEAMTLNTPDAFAAFLARYPDSDLAETARRMEERAKARGSFARSLSPVLGLSANAEGNDQGNAQDRAPQIRTVVREVKVPEIRTVVKEVVKEVRVPSPPEIRTVVREVVREVKVPYEVVKVVPAPCRCRPEGRPGRPRPPDFGNRRPPPHTGRPPPGRHPHAQTGPRNPRFQDRGPRRFNGGRGRDFR